MDAGIQALCMIEFNSIAAGIEAADAMTKAARVTPFLLKTICPGKYLAGYHGDVASAGAALAAGLGAGGAAVVDHFLIPNISAQVPAAMCCATSLDCGADPLGGPGGGPALGVIETFSAASCVVAADAAVKAASVQLLEVRLAMGLGGKAVCLLRGDVAAVRAATDAGSALAGQAGLLVNTVVIPSLAPELLPYIL
jgi:microcompartment protein CcmL/EutN